MNAMNIPSSKTLFQVPTNVEVPTQGPDPVTSDDWQEIVGCLEPMLISILPK